MVGILGVGHGVAQAAAVGLAADAPAIAHTVGGGGGHEGDVDVNFAGFNGTGASAVAADDGGGLQLAGGDHFAHPAPDARGLDAHDLALLDVIGNGIMGIAQRGGGNGQVVQTQLFNGGLHHHVHHEVSVPEVVVEGEGHAALGAALTQGVSQGCHDLAFLGLLVPAGAGGSLLDVFAVHVLLALIHFLAVYQQEIRNFTSYCIFHTRSPSYIPQALASRSVRRAPGMKATSIILPSTVNTPTPALDCSSKARTIFSA